jgi:Xaa-Pro aminopeptidase
MHNFIVNRENEIYYECGYSCDHALFLSLGGENFFITDGRYTLDAKENVKNSEVIEARDLIKKAKEILKKKRVKTLKIDTTNFSYDEIVSLQKAVKIQVEKNLSHKKRMIKSPKEIEIIKKSVKKGALSFSKFIKNIELENDEFELSYKFKEILTKRGSRDLSFEPIVAINENSAKPHAFLTDKKLKKGSILLLDAGIKHKRYCSDRTRTISTDYKLTDSKIQKFKDPKKQKIYDIVLKANEEAIKAVKVGEKLSTLDKIAREVIEKEGYGKYFVHSLGHGVGLDIHEWPYVNGRNDMTIENGMVFTIEPGIYLPNEFGVRIEDMVVVNEGKVEVMSEYI